MTRNTSKHDPSRSLCQNLVKDPQKKETIFNQRYNYDWPTWEEITNPKLCLGLIGQNYDFSTDNQAAESNSLSKWQRRRCSRKQHSRYELCEFGTTSPVKPLRCPNKCTYKNVNINSLVESTASTAKSVYAMSAVDSASSNQPIKGGRILNPANTKDRKRLSRIHRNLEALKRMSAAANNKQPFQLYKELPNISVKLKTDAPISIKAHDCILVHLVPDSPGVLLDKLWVAHQYEKADAPIKSNVIQIMSLHNILSYDV